MHCPPPHIRTQYIQFFDLRLKLTLGEYPTSSAISLILQFYFRYFVCIKNTLFYLKPTKGKKLTCSKEKKSHLWMDYEVNMIRYFSRIIPSLKSQMLHPCFAVRSHVFNRMHVFVCLFYS